MLKYVQIEDVILYGAPTTYKIKGQIQYHGRQFSHLSISMFADII